MISTSCPACGGAGKRIVDPCKDCEGTGTQLAEEKLTVNVPAGVDDGQTLRLMGQGELPVGVAGTPGNLYVNLRVQPHPRLKRDGPDLFVEVPLFFPLAALGGKVQIPVLKGEEEIDVPAGTQPGEVIVRRGAGAPRIDGRGRGDQVIRFQVQVPKKLTSKAKEMLRELADEIGEQELHRPGFFERFQKRKK